MGGRNRSNRRSFVRVILNSPPRHASFRPRTFPRVSPTTRVVLAGDGAGGGCVCVCRFVMILSSLSSLLPRPFPPPRAPPTHTSDTRVEWDGAGRRDEGRGGRVGSVDSTSDTRPSRASSSVPVRPRPNNKGRDATLTRHRSLFLARNLHLTERRLTVADDWSDSDSDSNAGSWAACVCVSVRAPTHNV